MEKKPVDLSSLTEYEKVLLLELKKVTEDRTGRETERRYAPSKMPLALSLLCMAVVIATHVIGDRHMPEWATEWISVVICMLAGFFVGRQEF